MITRMPQKEWTNREVSGLLENLAAALQIKDAAKNKFRIIAYENAAAAVEHSTSELKDIWEEGKLDAVPGIGESMTQHLEELFKTGRSKHFEEILSGIPPATFELIKLPGIGPKTAHKLVTNFKISDTHPLEDVKKLAREGKIKDIEGFGEESQKEILETIEAYKADSQRLLYSYALERASEILNWVKQQKEATRVDTLGSLRRGVSTIGDIDLAVATKSPQVVLDHFVNFPKKTKVIEKGSASASIVIPGGIQVDLMVQDPASYGSLLQHFTGSKHHNIALREYALKKGLSLSEYGIRNLAPGGVKKVGTQKMEKFETEAAFYKYLGLEYIPPELREDAGEIEAAKEGKIPNLIEISDVKGDFQIHSDFDIETSHDLGVSSMEEIILKADSLGYEYLAFTEHNPSKGEHNVNQIIDLLKAKREAVDVLNYSFVKTKCKSVKKVFNSLEIDILPNGELPVPEEGLATLDFALVSVHSSFRQSRVEATKRVLSALAYPKVKIFAHPTARKLLNREGIDLEWEKIFAYCVKNKKFLEINGDPARLDLPDFLVKEAQSRGVQFSLGTDSHYVGGLDNMQFGVLVARRGWVTKDKVLCTQSLDAVEKLLEIR